MKITNAPNIMAFVKIYVVSYLHPSNGRLIKPQAVPNIDRNQTCLSVLPPSLIFPFSAQRTFFGTFMPDVENTGTAVGISLTSCIEAEIDVIAYLLPVNGQPSLIYPLSAHLTVFGVVWSCHPTSKTWV